MGNGSSQEEEFHEGMLEISDRGLGSFRLVSIRDIFDKPLLTTSESSSTTTEDLAERCSCRCHEKLENGVEHCCGCNRPKITEPADGCSCQCHKALQEQLKKCCVCKTLVDPSNLPGDRQPEQASPEESSSSSANRWGLQTLSGWIFQNPSGESQNNESAGSQVEDSPEETSSNSSWVHLSESTSSEEPQGNPSTGTWWDFQRISYWLHQTNSADAQRCLDVNLSQQATSEES